MSYSIELEAKIPLCTGGIFFRSNPSQKGGREDRNVDNTYENRRPGGGNWGRHGSGDNENNDGRNSSRPTTRGGGGNEPWRENVGRRADLEWDEW